MKYILTAVLLAAIGASAETFDLGQVITFPVTCSQAEYVVERYDTTDGTWHISVSLLLVSPYQQAGPFSESPVRFDANTHMRLTVTGAEIADYAGLYPGQKPSEVMTGKQINDAVQAIAFAKVMAAYGVTP